LLAPILYVTIIQKGGKQIMAKSTNHKKLYLKLPIIQIEKPYKLNKPVVMIPEEEYKELLEDIQDLRDALKAEEEYLIEGGKSFAEYEKHRRKKR
jgi:BioD-like phosphotransacetylase family protein